MSGKAVGKTIHGNWSSPWMFVLVSAGFVVGLKNIWQFPHHLALYGGSAFLFAYFFFLLLLGVPMIMTQIMLGRLGRASPVTEFRQHCATRACRPCLAMGGRRQRVGRFSGVHLLRCRGRLDSRLCRTRRQRHPERIDL